MKRYDSYKDTGVDSIGEIPMEWKVTRIKFMAKICGGQDQKDVIDESGIYPIFGSGGEFGKTHQYLHKGPTVLLGRKGTIDKPRYVDTPFWSVDTAFYTDIFKGTNPRLFFYLCTTINFELYKYGSAIPSMSRETLNNIAFPLPSSLDEQIQIAKYLDQKTAQIDKLIADKQKLIELLNEERTAMINQAVTKGLNPNVPMKDSGIDWIGEIPSHWEIKALKYCFDIIGGFAFKSEDFKDEGIQLIKIGSLYQNQLQLNRQPTFVSTLFKETHKNYLAKKGDILMSLTGTLGKRDYGFAILIDEDLELLINQRVAKIITKQNLNIGYSISLFHSETFLNKLFSIPTGTKQGNLSGDDILSISMAIPPLDEQLAISEFIDNYKKKNNALISKSNQEIELLKEYKTALISEVVTGKVDVRDEVIACDVTESMETLINI